MSMTCVLASTNSLDIEKKHESEEGIQALGLVPLVIYGVFP